MILRAAMMVLLASGGAALAASPVADSQLYLVFGGSDPVFGHKLANPAGGHNFLTCDGTAISVEDKNLKATGGNCGDTSAHADAGGIVVYTIASAPGGKYLLHVVDTNANVAQPFLNRNVLITEGQLKSNPATKDATTGTKLWITNDPGAFAKLKTD